MSETNKSKRYIDSPPPGHEPSLTARVAVDIEEGRGVTISRHPISSPARLKGGKPARAASSGVQGQPVSPVVFVPCACRLGKQM